MKHKRTRLFVYSFLAVPVLAAGFALLTMAPHERSSFLFDYSRTLRRMVSGNWELSELWKDQRSPNPRNWTFSTGDRGHDAGAIFDRLDTSNDGELDQTEVGARLAACLGKAGLEQFSLTVEQFQKSMQSSRSTEQTNPSKPTIDADSAELTADVLFDSDTVAQIEISLAHDDWESLCAQSRSFQSAVEDPLAKPYTYFRGDIKVNGLLIEGVGIRKKGFIGSQDQIRPALKIKFD